MPRKGGGASLSDDTENLQIIQMSNTIIIIIIIVIIIIVIFIIIIFGVIILIRITIMLKYWWKSVTFELPWARASPRPHLDSFFLKSEFEANFMQIE